MGNKKFKIMIILGAILFITGAVAFFATVIIESDKFIFLSLIPFAGGGILFATGFNLNRASVYTKRRMNDTTSLYYQTYGNGNKFNHFLAKINIKKQQAANTATNVIGVLSFALCRSRSL